ncbi:hypothetical protein PIB30_003651 [Stylosanthes scabra]|uniref:Disease resistance protein RPS4B/Roq1-like leucine-rich repeats domain-containing protein n=1 Tax=Stylosanthes scabra TaxID=79078 RepID=A0ABU6Z0H7_9FABA|nr:hypothetical protein [Stylosanthes scabra]
MLNAEHCCKLRSFPPTIKLPSLEELILFGCSSLEYFPEIPEEMENLQVLNLYDTGIKDLPCSFCNLSRLRHLNIVGDAMCKIPIVIGMMPKLMFCDIKGGGNKGRVSREQMEGLQGILTTHSHSLYSSNMIRLCLRNSNLSDEFFPLAVTWFPNVLLLDLSGNNFRILPECVQEFRCLLTLNVDHCKHLQEIRGIPPRLTSFSAVNCKSLSPRGTSVLLNQKVLEGRSAEFVMPGRRIPRWFEKRRSGASISFWFRGTIFPLNALCVAILLKDDIPSPMQVTPIATINGYQVSSGKEIRVDQFLILNLKGKYYDKSLPFNKIGWNHVEVSYKACRGPNFYYKVIPIESIAKEIGMHVVKQKSSSVIQDIRFTDPYRMTQLIIMMMMVSIVFPNHKKQPLLLETRIGLWTLLFFTNTL